MTAREFFDILLPAFFVLAAVAMTVVLFIPAPYGRHERPGWGPTMPARLAWLVMELPAVLVPALVFAASQRRTELVPWVLLLMWQSHYLHRTFVWPTRARLSGKRTPVVICALAFVTNCGIDWLNAVWVFELSPPWATQWLYDPRFVAGAALFFGGMALNRRADAILLNLRKPGEAGYRIPTGGPYRWVSCPNYLGELVEWLGWALATWSMAGLAFAVWSAANLVPRALSNHRWYLATFPSYPADRKALIPFVL